MPLGVLDASPSAGLRRAAYVAAALVALLALTGCEWPGSTGPRHYLIITHSAINRVTFYDLDARRVVGALPAQKLPHDMLLSHDQKSVVVFGTGAQCATVYHLDSPELWRRAREFMLSDSVHARRAVAPPPPVRRDHPGILNPDPVQELPASVAEFHLTDPTFPDSAAVAHARVRASDHRSCFDCHDRSHGGKPFGPVYSADGRLIYVAHLAYRNIAVLDAATLAVTQRIALPIPADLSPVEIWLQPGTDVAWITCRNLTGMNRPGRILAISLASGQVRASIEAGIYPWHMVPMPGGRRLLVNNFQGSRISIVDLTRRTIVDSLQVQNGPAGMLVLPDSQRVAVSCFYTNNVLVVNLHSRAVEAVIPVGSNPTSMLLDRDGRHLDVLCGGQSEIDHLDLAASRVVERHSLLFGAYSFALVDQDHSGRWVGATGPTIQSASAIGARP